MLFALGSANALADELPIDAALEAGQRFDGRIAFTGDVDRVTISGMPGARIRLVAKAIDDAQVRPRFDVWSDGTLLDPPQKDVRVAAAGRLFAIDRIQLPSSGVIDVRIHAATGALGRYRLRSDEIVPQRVAESP